MVDKNKTNEDDLSLEDNEEDLTTINFTPDEDLHPDVIAALKLDKKTKPNPTEYLSAQEEKDLEQEEVSTLF